MNRIGTVKKIVSIYKPALVLEHVYPRVKRKKVELFLLATVAVCIGLYFFFSNTIVSVILSITFVLLLLNLFLDLMWNSYFFEGTERILSEFGFPTLTNQVPLEVAEIVWKGNNNVSRGLLTSTTGGRLLERLEIDTSVAQEWSVNEGGLLERVPTSIADVAEYIAENDAVIMDHFLKAGVTPKALVGAARWLDEEIALEKENRRTWGRDNLGRIPSIGTDWSNARAYTLNKFGKFIADTHYYSHMTTDVREVEREIQSLETVLARDKEANVVVLSDDQERALSLMGRLQRHIDRGRVLPPLEHKKIFVFEAHQAVALTRDKEELESLLMTIFAEVAKSRNIILCIPSFASFVSAAKNNTVDVLTLLERFLSSASVRVIAVESEDIYQRELETNPVIRELFETLHANVDSRAIEAIISRSILEYERYYGVKFTYPALLELQQALSRFFSDSILSDAADDLLNELVPYAFSEGVRIINSDVVKRYLAQKTGVPTVLSRQDTEALLDLEKTMSERVIGQQDALSAISKALRRAHSGVRGGRKPMGSFLFLGPTGVGKTKTARTLAEVFFGGEEAMMRFDMTEFQGSDALSRLIGDVNGTPGLLSERLRKNPYSLVLLDEFEKTSDEVKNLFLQIFDEGIFRDGNGRQVSATDAIFIATSNAASDTVWDLFQKGEDLSTHKNEIINTVVAEQTFRPELLNRFDGIVVFRPLSESDLRQIASIMLEGLSTRLYENEAIEVEFASDVTDFLVRNGYDPKFGARPMRRLIQDTIEDALAEKLLNREIGGGSKIILRASDLANN